MATENKTIDYAAMIADLQAKRAAIDSAITSLILASGAVMPIADGTASVSYSSITNTDRQPTELPRGAFLGKSLPAAVKLYLSAVMKKQTIKEIATALREGGVESTSDNFENVITGCVNRMKANGELLRFKDGWALAEFYPEHLRRNLSPEGAAKRKTAVKKTKKPKKTVKSAVYPSDKPQAVEGLGGRIAAYFQNHQGTWLTHKEVADAFPGTTPAVIALMLGQLAKKHGWEKSGDGKYRVGIVANIQEMPKAV